MKLPNRWTDDEYQHLLYLLHDAWSWQFPGYKWVAEQLNNQWHNDRTPNACRLKEVAMTRKWRAK